MAIVGGTVSPGCLNNDCTTYGWSKLTDSIEQGTSSLASTSSGSAPYMQLDLGLVRTDILGVRLVARADSNLYESQGLNVYVSISPDFSAAGSVLCQANVSIEALGEDMMVECPLNVTGQYVTVQRISAATAGRRLQQVNTGVLSLQEMQVLMDGELSELHETSQLFFVACAPLGCRRTLLYFT